MDIGLEDLKEMLFTFGRQVAPNMPDEEVESLAEEYLAANEDRFLMEFEPYSRAREE
jgi:hypothetical protein